MSQYSELLYHTVLTVVDYHEDPSGAKHSVYVLATHESVEAAKEYAVQALHHLNYEPDDFAEYAVHTGTEEWSHGDGVLVYARAPAGQVFSVGIKTTANNESLLANPDGSIVLPKGTELLHYVVQTTIDYNKDRTGCMQDAEIEGAYLLRADAFAAARKLLDPADFAEYDDRDGAEGEWPYGEDVLVHAVAETGQNYTVAVTTVPGAHKRHSRKR